MWRFIQVPEVRLGSIRPGFDWSINITYPAGFLAAGESVRMTLRKFAGSTEPAVCDSIRTGDTVTVSLPAALTALLDEGTYIAEAIIFTPLDVTVPEIPLTTNRYLIQCERSPSE